MKFEEIDDGGARYRITFEGEEIDVIAAAFTEDISLWLQKGNSSSFTEFDKRLSKWRRDEMDIKIERFPNYISLAEKLEDFHGRTDELLFEMAVEKTVPEYLKTHISDRHTLGQAALKLAINLRESGYAVARNMPDPNDLDLDSELHNLLDDSAGQEAADQED
ncbi:MAG TPA: hypothetical protein VFW52_00095 [Candidatus Saccharimonadales bacterium]|nr:hypothetical protein [Candidatus Saccharimonadales bacterium]